MTTTMSPMSEADQRALTAEIRMKDARDWGQEVVKRLNALVMYGIPSLEVIDPELSRLTTMMAKNAAGMADDLACMLAELVPLLLEVEAELEARAHGD